MLHCLNTPGNVAGVKDMEISVLERQRMFLKWQQEQLLQVQPQQELNCFSDTNMLSFLTTEAKDFQSPNMIYGPTPVTTSPTLNKVLNQPIKADPAAEHGWMNFEMPTSGVSGESLQIESTEQVYAGHEMNFGISKTASYPPSVVAAEVKGRESLPSDQKLRGAAGRESFKKRKAETNFSSVKVVEAEEDDRSKKSKGYADEEESKITEQHSNRQGNSSQSNQKGNKGNKKDKKKNESSELTSRDNDSKASEVQKPDYIHVRARRGQATDSHSLAERVRREKISERMKYLQELVPGCNKITGKAGMLDEIINYVQSLQRQVEFLSMKLAAANPRLDLSINDFVAKEILAACSTNLPMMEVPSNVMNPSYLPYNPIELLDPVCGSGVGVNQVDLGLRRSISTPMSIPDNFLGTSCFNQIPHYLQWDANLQSIYNMEFPQERSTTFPLQTFQGTVEASNLKMEI